MEVKGQILEIKSHEEEALVKEPNKPSELPISPTSPSSMDKTADNTQNVNNSDEILKADSTYENAINIDKEIRVDNNEALVKEPSKPSNIANIPFING